MNLYAQRTLLVITMLATGLVMGDGILMPAFSVVSSISGLRGHTSISTDGMSTDRMLVLLIWMRVLQVQLA